jgi:hypothetical protein
MKGYPHARLIKNATLFKAHTNYKLISIGRILTMSRNVYDEFQGSLYLFLLLLLLICLVSCCPAFKNPIAPPAELKADPQILGAWVRTYKVDESEYKEQMSIFSRSNGWIDVVWIYDIDKKESTEGVSLLVLEGYSASVNKERFLCLRIRKRDFNWTGQKNPSWTEEGGGLRFTKNWMIANYETPTNDELVVKPFSTHRVEELIEKGKLKREVKKKKDLFGKPEPARDEVTVTSSSDELVKVISEEGVGAFISDDPNDMRFMNVLVFTKLDK